jgi:hypothetical protein
MAGCNSIYHHKENVMNINKPQIYSAGSAVCAIQGQPSVSILSEKGSTNPDKNAALIGDSRATVGAYQADE